jgi:hypothetical protein
LLQIVTGLYFRECVKLNSTTHRQVYYTNCSFPPFDGVVFPVGRILPSTTLSAVSAVMIEAVEHREALAADGTDDFVIASGGTELLDDVAAVLSFAMNSIFSRDHDLVRRLVPESSGGSARPSAKRPVDQLRDTFDANRFVSTAAIDEAREFMGSSPSGAPSTNRPSARSGASSLPGARSATTRPPRTQTSSPHSSRWLTRHSTSRRPRGRTSTAASASSSTPRWPTWTRPRRRRCARR